MDADLGDGAPLGGAAASASRRRLVDAASAGPMPTRLAEASRALGGNTTTAEQYAFAGVACVLDQHQGKRAASSGAPTRLRFANNDAARLAAGGADGRVSVSLVAPAPAPPELLCLLAGHTGPVSHVAWSTDNDLLLSASVDGTARVWRVDKAACLRQFPPPPPPSAPSSTDPQQLPPLYAAEFVPSNNNLFVAGGCARGGGGQLVSVNLSTGLSQSQLRLPAPVACLAFGSEPPPPPALPGSAGVGGVGVSSSHHQLWLGDTAGCLLRCRLDAATGQLVRLASLPVSGSPIASVQARSWLSREARDPCLLVCSTTASGVLLFRLETGPDRGGNGDSGVGYRPVLRRRLPVPAPTRAAFCPLMSFRPGACVVCASADTGVYIADVGRDARPIVNHLQGHASPVTDVAFNYDESLLASADAEGTVIIWRRA